MIHCLNFILFPTLIQLKFFFVIATILLQLLVGELLTLIILFFFISLNTGLNIVELIIIKQK